MRIPTIAIALALLVLVPALRAADLDVSGLQTPRDKIIAGKRLFTWAESLGYKVRLSDDGEDVFVFDTKLSLSPKLTDDRIDRIVVYNHYKGKAGNRSNVELAAVIAKLNSDLNTVSIFLDGDDVAFVSSLAFDDTLSPRLLKLFMDFSNSNAELVIKANPALSKYIQ